MSREVEALHAELVEVRRVLDRVAKCPAVSRTLAELDRVDNEAARAKELIAWRASFAAMTPEEREAKILELGAARSRTREHDLVATKSLEAIRDWGRDLSDRGRQALLDLLQIDDRDTLKRLRYDWSPEVPSLLVKAFADVRTRAIDVPLARADALSASGVELQVTRPGVVSYPGIALMKGETIVSARRWKAIEEIDLDLASLVRANVLATEPIPAGDHRCLRGG